RGSHTHTVVTPPSDTANLYIYVSGTASVRSPTELAGCSDLTPDQDPNSERFRIEVIQVPVAHPEQAHVVSKPAILADLAHRESHSEAPTGADSTTLRAAVQGIVDRRFNPPTPGNGPRPGPVQCHDITVYPALGIAGGACAGYGLLLDIRDPVQPRRIAAVADSNFAFWHAATFNNDGTKLLFTDEWGGGLQP